MEVSHRSLTGMTLGQLLSHPRVPGGPLVKASLLLQRHLVPSSSTFSAMGELRVSLSLSTLRWEVKKALIYQHILGQHGRLPP